jgi:DNA-binding transcriptional LysR family regulator
VRLGTFAQHEVVRRKLGQVGFGLYAAPAYLERRGKPDFTGGAEGHAIVQMTDALGAAFPDSAWLAEVAPRARVACQSTSRDAQAALASAGVGLTTLPRALGDATPGLRLLVPPAPVPGRKVWLGVHRDTRSTPRVRALADFLAKEMRRLGPAPAP